MSNIPVKRAKTDVLPDSSVYLSFPVSRKSTLFKDYIKTQLETSENPWHIFLEDFSFNTYIDYFALLLNEVKRKEGRHKIASIDWELACLANKLQNKDVFDILRKQVEDLKITKENVIDVTTSALENNEHECSELAELILKRCVEAVSNQKISLWDGYIENKEEFEKAALYLTRELGKLKGNSKEDKSEEANSSHKADDRGAGSLDTSTDIFRVFDLGADQVFITYPVSKKLLALKSSVFRSKFCGIKRSRMPRGQTEYLPLTEFSLEAYAQFFTLLSEKEVKKRYLYLEHNCQLILEILLLADFYQAQDYVRYMKIMAKRVVITEENVLYVASDALKFKEHLATQDSCKDILKKCVEFIHYKQLNIWRDFEQNNTYHDAYDCLARELIEFREKQKVCTHGAECEMKPKCAVKEVCKNCGTLPCLKNQDVKIVNSGTTYLCKYADSVKSQKLIDFNTIADANNREYKRQWLTYGCP